MAKRVYLGVSNVARKVRRLYVGVNNVSRKVKRGYIGVNGVARLFYTSVMQCVEHGEAPSLGANKNSLFAASTPDYGIFAGGNDPNSSFSELASVRAYNKSLTAQAIAELDVNKANGASVSFRGRAVFAGGYKGVFMGYQHYNGVNSYDNSLTKYTHTILSQAKGGLAGTAVGDYVIFAGGANGSQALANVTASADAYNSSFTKVTVSSLSVARKRLAATTIGNYAIFAGGIDNSNNEIDTVDVYDSSLTKTIGPSLSDKKYSMGAGSNEYYALFAGGYGTATGYYGSADVYDKNLTHTTCYNPMGYEMRGTSLGGNIIMTGGFISDNGMDAYSTGFSVFDDSLTLTNPQKLTYARDRHGAVSFGNFVLVGGGYNGKAISSVEYFKFV